MKKYIISKNKILMIILFILCIVIAFVLYSYLISPQHHLEKKYDKNYVSIEKISQDSYTAYLGKDNQNIYLDIFLNKKYFGGASKKINSNEDISLYQFQHKKSLYIVFGENKALKYSSYTLDFDEYISNPVSFSKNIEDTNYILDIYILDNRYQCSGNVHLYC